MKKILSFILAAFIAMGGTAYAEHGSHGQCSMKQMDCCKGGERGDQGKHHDFGEMFFWKAKFLIHNAKELGLSDEQVNAIKDRKYELKRQKIQSESQMELIMLDVKKQMKSDKPVVEELNRLIDQKMELKKTLVKAYIQGKVEIMGMLSPDQRNKMKEMFEKKMHG